VRAAMTGRSRESPARLGDGVRGAGAVWSVRCAAFFHADRQDAGTGSSRGENPWRRFESCTPERPSPMELCDFAHAFSFSRWACL